MVPVSTLFDKSLHVTPEEKKQVEHIGICNSNN